MRSERVIVEGDYAKCKYGSVICIVNASLCNSVLFLNNKKCIVNDLLNKHFTVPAFGTCLKIPNSPKPCTVVITHWSKGAFKIENKYSALTDKSKGSCMIGGKRCICFM